VGAAWLLSVPVEKVLRCRHLLAHPGLTAEDPDPALEQARGQGGQWPNFADHLHMPACRSLQRWRRLNEIAVSFAQSASFQSTRHVCLYRHS